jgi:hypothetical protein
MPHVWMSRQALRYYVKCLDKDPLTLYNEVKTMFAMMNKVLLIGLVVLLLFQT